MWGRAKYLSVLPGAIAAAALALAGCVEEPRQGAERPVYVTTIPPLAAILGEVAGERAEVKSLLAPGASPHTYEPKPSDMKAVEKAKGLFFAQENVDGWALSFAQANRIEMFQLVPEDVRHEMPAGRHDDSRRGKDAPDGHFWTSPR
jgi:ABC-type Zn uptake system ZnuABC Zn-binding protein ZnuA